MALIYLYESTETDFRYNGKPLPKAVVDVSWGLNSEFYATGRYPVNEDEVYKEILEDRIVKVHTFHGMEPMRIVDVQDRDLYVEFEAWPLFFADMRNKMVKPLNLRDATGQAALSAFFNSLLIKSRFNFYSNITETHDYHTQDEDERENNPNQLYDALEVFSALVRRWNGEISIRGYDIRMNKRIGTDTEALLYEKKNITEFLDGTNIKNIVTRAHGKTEWTEEDSDGEQVEHSIQATVDSPLINAYSGIIFERQYTNNDVRSVEELKDWLSLKFSTENLDKPTRSIEVNTNMINGTNVGPADTLILKYIKHDVDTRIKIVGYIYDGFANKLKRFILGEPRTTVTDTIGNTITETINNVVRPIAQTAIRAQQTADGKRTKYSGTQDPNTLNLNANKDDEYWRDIGDETIIYEFNGTTWDVIIDTSETTKNADAIAEQQQDIEEAKQTADEAVGKIDTAVANAGFTSLDDTLQNMNYITMNAEQYAQQAITNASDAYGLAQTSISEAQTAQANSLTALGKADNALDGVSNLNVRVDDVEAELELKADNTFMNEDGTLTTLSNAITFNAHRFSSDMNRIESRVESLAGEINLVILRDAFENSRLNPGTMYPNPASAGPDYQTMRELIAVQGGEKLAMSKETSPSGFNQFRFNFYDDTGAYLIGETSTLNQYIVTVPQSATKMWVSYPTGSKPQIVRGTFFVPYRPNLADQMTSDEMVLFRNEYDEYADRTERRLTAIDSTGGSLDVLGNEIIKSAERVTTDMTALINTKVGDDEFTEFYQNEYLETAQEVSRKISLSDIEVGGVNRALESVERGFNLGSRLVSSNAYRSFTTAVLPIGEYIISHKTDMGVRLEPSANVTFLDGSGLYNFAEPLRIEVTTESSFNVSMRKSDTSDLGDEYLTLDEIKFKIEKGNIVTDWAPAPEDTDAKISHIETEWTQTFESFEQTITGEGGINAQLQTLDKSMSSIVDPVTGRLSIVEQIAGGLQASIVDKANQSQVTQLSNVWSASVGKLTDFIYNSTFEDGSSLGWEGITVETGYTYSPSKYYGAIRQRDAYFGDLIPIEGGERLNFSIHAWNFTSSPQTFRFGVRYYDKDKNPISWYTAIQSSKGNVLEKHTASWVTSASARYVRPWVQISAHSNFTPWYFSQPQISRVPTNAQMSMLENNINLRVQKGDLLSQINIEADRQLFQSGKILFDAENVIFTGKAWIPSSVIGDLEADKITSGTLDAGQITVVNLDANSITTNRAQMVQAGFNAINSSLSVDGNSLTYTHSNGSQTILSAGGLYHREGGTNYQSHYLMEVGTETIDTHDLPITGGRLVTLPSVFRGKPFKVIISIADVLSHELTNYEQFAIQRLVAFPAKDSINHANGTFRIYGYARMINTNTREVFHSRIQVQYTVIA